MSLFITSLNSGSNGNCYYIGNDKDAVLIDAGISCRETENRMKRLQLSMHSVKAIFISHEHSDHIQGVPVLAKKYQLPVYVTPATLRGCGHTLISHPLLKLFVPYQPVTIGSLFITAFPKLHDAAEPHSFTVSDQSITIGVFTDIGSPCKHVIHHFKLCHAAFLEANYDEAMLERGKYPVHLKRRIASSVGHLSNRQALELFIQHKPPFMSHLLLAHLSKENNHPQLVENLFTAHAGNTKIIVASRYAETKLFEVNHTLPATPAGHYFQHQKATVAQLSLF